MMNLIYVITTAIAFTYKFEGENVYFWLKYIIAISWILIWLFKILNSDKKIQGRDLFYLKILALPYILILLLTFFMWIINKPSVFDYSYLSRTISNILCLEISIVSAIACANLFKRNVIKLSCYAIYLSTLANIIRSIQIFGFNIFIEFLKSAWIVTDFNPSRPTFKISQMLEVHDSTIACGLFLIYFLFFSKDKIKTKIIHIILLIICAYIGFKRITFVAIATVFAFIFLLKKRNYAYSNIVKIIGIIFVTLSFGYVIIIKTGFAETLSIILGIDFSGRFTIYNKLATYYSISPFYLGTGYGYINKLFEETIGLASHADIVRMYIELGFIPYFIWLYHYLFNIPIKIKKRYGKDVAMVILACTIYMFTTYFVGNAMNLHCIQYSYALLPIALSYPEIKERKIKFII